MAYERSALGITGIQQVAEHLADFGRFGDGYVVHASKGETVIPLAVLNENPRLKAALFTQMRDMGLEPKRYVVGDKLNSINPVTGQPEFFFKKLFKGLKKVVKTIAPVVLPVALSMTRLGPIFGAAAGTGIASLIGGESFGKSLKNSVIAGGIGGLYAGLTGAYGAQSGKRLEGFKKGVSDAFKQPFAARAPSALAPIEDRSEAIGTDTGPDATSPVDAASEIRPLTARDALLPGGELQPLGAYKPGLPGSDFAGSDFQIQARNPLFGQTTPQTLPPGARFGTFSTDPPPLLPSSRYSGANIPSTRYTGGISARGPEMGRRRPFEPRVPRSDYLTPSRTIISGDPSGSPSYIDPNTGVTTYGIAPDPIRGEVALGTPYSGEAFTNRNALGLRSPIAPIVDRSIPYNPPPASTIGGGAVNTNIPTVSAGGGGPNVTAGGEGAGGRGRFAKARDLMVRRGLTPDQVEGIKQAAYDKAFLRTNGNVEIANAAYNAAGPGILAKYGPSTALGLGAAGLFGAFEPGEEPEPVDFYDQMYGPNSALGRLQSNPGLFSVGIPSPAYTPATLDDIRYSAMGGPINQNNFPPRIGAINGPGTGTSDDIPAMLSDGEYVMTAKAVRGAGNGNRKQGMQNMYNMMRQFEGQTV